MPDCCAHRASLVVRDAILVQDDLTCATATEGACRLANNAHISGLEHAVDVRTGPLHFVISDPQHQGPLKGSAIALARTEA